MTKTTPHIRVHHHNDYLISFYAGRDQSERHLKERNWLDDSALKLGTAMYAIHSGAEVPSPAWPMRNSCAAISNNWDSEIHRGP